MRPPQELLVSRLHILRQRAGAWLAPPTDSVVVLPLAEPEAPPEPPPAGRQPLAGTYVGNGRVLVYLETGGRLYVSADDLTLVPELLKTGIYDVPFTRFLHRTLTPNSTFVDVGANVGLFSIIGGYLAWTGQVIAYEPAPALHALLRDNVAANWLNGRVRIRPVAVGRGPGRAVFGFPVTMHMLGGIDLTPASFAALYPGVEVLETEVEVVCLDDELADAGHVDLVKIDVEGGEAEVLRGMRGLVANRRVSRVSLEVRRDAFDRNRAGAGWDDLADELRHLSEMGGDFAVPDEAGQLCPVALDEVLEVALYSNLVVTLPT